MRESYYLPVPGSTGAATSRRKAGFAVYSQDLPAETLDYLLEPTVRQQQNSSVQSSCHASVVVPYVVLTLASDRLARHRKTGTRAESDCLPAKGSGRTWNEIGRGRVQNN